MSRGIVLCAVVLIASCTSTPPRPSLSVLVPADLQTCPDGIQPPAVPKPPRTVPQIVNWGIGNYSAWAGTERARKQCQQRLTMLNQWMARYLKTGKPDGS